MGLKKRGCLDVRMWANWSTVRAAPVLREGLIGDLHHRRPCPGGAEHAIEFGCCRRSCGVCRAVARPATGRRERCLGDEIQEGRLN